VLEIFLRYNHGEVGHRKNGDRLLSFVRSVRKAH
jgi:hypothetical protein